jgi:hypothetical protein
MPATEYLDWQEYFSLYPFSEDREDARTAEVLAMLVNTNRMLMASLAGKRTAPELINPVRFLPDYLKEKSTPMIEKSLEQQKADWEKFKAAYRAAERGNPL